MSSQDTSSGARGCRPETEAFHRKAVERAVVAMEQRFSEEGLGLSAIAAEAISSRFHFARFFRHILGVPPCHFLTAVRMHRAKQLLADTGMSVTNVCLEVGYSSLGTFTRRFTELVGLPPKAFRRSARRLLPVPDVRLFECAIAKGGKGEVTGQISAPVTGLIAVGLFPSAIPQGRPVACCIVPGPGPYRIAGVPAGRYFVLAAALEANGQLSQDPEFRGSSGEAIEVSERPLEIRVDIQLRPHDVVDPPILLALPSLLTNRMRATADAAAKLPSRIEHTTLSSCARRPDHSS